MSGAEFRPGMKARIEDAYRTQRGHFVAHAHRGGRSVEDAEDIVQDVVLKSLESVDAYTDIASVGAWIFGSIGKRVIDWWRHDQVRRKVGEVDVADETIAEIVAATGLNPADALVRAELAEAIADAVAALPKAQREVIEAQVYEGLTFRELSEKTGTGIDTLAARKRYAIKNLSKALSGWLDT